LSGKPNNFINELKKIGKQAGIAFQIQDDLFEIFGDERNMGKSLGSDIFSNKKTAIAIEAKNSFQSEWDTIVEQFDGKSLVYIRNFLSENKIKDKIEALAHDNFQSTYNSLLSLGFDKKSELFRVIKIIEGRHS
jgi:geranylgeranyl pyrophosphate synthase